MIPSVLPCRSRAFACAVLLWAIQACDPDLRDPVGPAGISADGPPLLTGDPPPTPIPPVLSCNSPSSWGTYGSCTINVPGHHFSGQISGWVFSNGQGAYVERTWGTNEVYWGGEMVTSGTVQVDVWYDDEHYPLSAQISVPLRQFGLPAWASRVSVRWAFGAEIDHCFLPNLGGITTNRDCTSSTVGALFHPTTIGLGDGIDLDMVDDNGPNGGLYYVSGGTAHAHMVAQMWWESRPDDPLYPTNVGHSGVTSNCTGFRSHFSVNTGCAFAAGFGNYTNYIEVHEWKHLNAAYGEAVKGSNDVFLSWNNLVGQNPNQIYIQAGNSYGAIHEQVATASICTHTGGTGPTFLFWRYFTPNGWTASGAAGDESIPSWAVC